MFRLVQLGYPAGMPQHVTHVFFDFTNTLVRVRGSVGQIYADVAAHHGLRVPADELDVHFNTAIASIPQPVAPDLPPETIAERERQWWRDVAWGAFEPFNDFPGFDAFFDEVFELFRRVEPWELLPGVHGTLEALRSQGRTLGVISDMDARLHDVLDVLGLRDFFTIVCLSFRTGYAKPSRKLYEAALHEAKATPAQCVHVGDSVSKDVEAALAVGMHAIHLDEKSTSNTPARAHAVRALDEIPPLLDRVERLD